MENKNLYNYFSISNHLQKSKNQPNNQILRLKLEVKCPLPLGGRGH